MRLRPLGLRWQTAVLLGPALVLFALFFVWPLVEILRISFGSSQADQGMAEGFARFTASPVLRIVFLRTFEMAGVVTLCCLVLAYPAAYFITTLSRGWRAAALGLVLLPFWTSTLVRTYTWMVLLGREGLVNGALQWLGLTDAPVRLLFTPTAVYLAIVQIMLPLMILTLYSSMAELDAGLIRAARILGAPRWRAFWHVYLPMTVPGVIAGSVMVFILTLGFYITPALLGGPRLRTLANLIDLEVHQMNNWANASAIAVVLLLVTLACVGLLRLLVPERNLFGGAAR